MAIDVARVRADTPAADDAVHLNHAGASPSPRPVLDEVIGHLRREAEIGGYEAAEERAADLEAVRADVGRLVGAPADSVALTESAGVAWTRGFRALPLREGDVVLVGSAEYVTNAMNLLDARDRRGIRIEAIPDGPDGAVDLEALERRLAAGPVALVCLTHVPTSGGLVNPAAEVGRLCREHGALFQLDACQSAGQLPLDVGALGCHLLSATGRKFLRAPRGTGFLVVDPALVDRLEPAEVDAGAAVWSTPDRFDWLPGARRLESWERNWAAGLGLGVAVRYALDLGLDDIAARVGHLADRLRTGLADVAGVTVTDRGTQRCGIVTFTVDGRRPDAVLAHLRAGGVRVWTVPAVAAQFDLGARGIDEVVRASVHYVTTEDEVDRAVAGVAALARG